MSGAKLNLAKSSVLSLIESLDDTHSMTLINFDSEASIFSLTSAGFYEDVIYSSLVAANKSFDATKNSYPDQYTFYCRNDTHTVVSEYFDSLNSTYGTIANITRAVEAATILDDYVRYDKIIPENNLSMIILLTDGRSASGNKTEVIGKQIRVLNKVNRIPIFSIGIGFDANTEFLEDIAGLLLSLFRV